MKTILPLIISFHFSVVIFAQDLPASSGHLEARYDSGTGMISYRTIGEVTKDGIKVIELKNSALEFYVNSHPLQDFILVAIQKEKESLEALRIRILLQRERLIKPMPAMQEVH